MPTWKGQDYRWNWCDNNERLHAGTLGGVMWSVRMKTVMQELHSKIMQMYNLNIVMCTMLDKKTLIVIDV